MYKKELKKCDNPKCTNTYFGGANSKFCPDCKNERDKAVKNAYNKRTRSVKVKGDKIPEIEKDKYCAWEGCKKVNGLYHSHYSRSKFCSPECANEYARKNKIGFHSLKTGKK